MSAALLFDDSYYMQQALQQAQYAFEANEIPVGCIVVFKDRIIAKGYNLTEQLKDVTAHAEMQAITAASNTLGGKYLKDCTVYITLEPCNMCAGALYWSQVSRVVFGASDMQRGYRAFGGKLHPKTKVTFGVLEKECAALLKDFFTKRRFYQ